MTDFSSCSQVLEKIDLTSKLFLKTFKKSPKCELVYSLGGTYKMPIHNLAVWHDGSVEQGKEIQFIKESL